MCIRDRCKKHIAKRFAAGPVAPVLASDDRQHVVGQFLDDLVGGRGLRRGVQRLTCEGPDDWQSYGGRPLDFAAAPGSLLSEELRDSIQLQLDFGIGLQGDDSGWQPNWSWGAV